MLAALALVLNRQGSSSAMKAPPAAPSKTAADMPLAREGRYWLTGNEPIETAAQRGQAFGRLVDELLARHANASPLAAEVRKIGERVFISQTFGEHAQLLSFDRSLTNDDFGKKLMLTLITERDAPLYFRQVADGRRFLAMYHDDRHQVLIPATTASDTWFAALLFHEMGHALRRDQRLAAGVTETPISFAEEEAEMHMLENVILDSATGGKVSAFYRQMLAKLAPPGTDPINVCRQIPVDDMRIYFALIGVTTLDEAGAIGQFCLSLGFLALEREGKTSLAERGKFYNAFTHRFGG